MYKIRLQELVLLKVVNSVLNTQKENKKGNILIIVKGMFDTASERVKSSFL